jgi:hypothetical protein
MKKIICLVFTFCFFVGIANAQIFNSSFDTNIFGGNRYHNYYGRCDTGGIKFNLNLIDKKDKANQKMVERGIVTLDGFEQGIVKEFNGWYRGYIEVVVGVHQIKVELEDGREFMSKIEVLPCRMRSVPLRFPPLEK